jgi:tRNA (mo5U34)-methyltransferase
VNGDLASRVREHGWYHTLDLPGGVTTHGLFDLRHLPAQLPIPASLAGMRCLDVGTADGFWAFELERRGAAAVVAVDVADPSTRDVTYGTVPAEGAVARGVSTFALAASALGSGVEWRDVGVYDLSPDVVGTFDFVFIGSLLLHLRDPVRALLAVRSVLNPGGRLLSHDSISLSLTLRAPRLPAAVLHGQNEQEWWIPNRAGRRREIEAAGFRVVQSGGITWVKWRGPRATLRSVREHPLLSATLMLKGVPNVWVLAEPR